MYIEGSTIDDIINKLYSKIRDEGQPVINQKGSNKEVLGVYIKLTNPLSRISLSHTRGLPISPLGELLWYLSGSNQLKFIKYYLKTYGKYSDDSHTLYGAYGKRLFNKDGEINQVELVINKLKENPSTRQAVMQIYDARDLSVNSKDIPCTCTLQFVIRENRLHLFTTMRSNDAFVGFVHDVFAFTMIQEIIARILNVELGYYNHFVSSMHLYDNNNCKIEEYLGEGFQSHKLSMDPMPHINIRKDIKKVLKWEEEIREGILHHLDDLEIDDYWKDILILLKIFSIKNDNEEVIRLSKNIKSNIFKLLIEEKYKC